MAEKEHGPECECGCNCNEDDTITLEFDNGSVVCEPLGIFDFEGKEYVALVPAEDEESEDVYIYEYVELSEDEFEFRDIESDEEFDRVTAEFERLMEEAEKEEE